MNSNIIYQVERTKSIESQTIRVTDNQLAMIKHDPNVKTVKISQVYDGGSEGGSMTVGDSPTDCLHTGAELVRRVSTCVIY